ncbi:MAG: hypothetical protein CMG35_04735 [Candidatus Marinimicrobia bacterium]|nr:hypothetical protein [Candidatus Neomarinimicrobiota bacterium]|tara:strand:+ start:1909 stop:2601 length:693 start_codon:yes stop_codon:yes gene_type:complete
MIQGYEIIKNCFDPVDLAKCSQDLLDRKEDSYIYEHDGSIRSVFAPHWYNKNVEKFVYNNPAIPRIKELIADEIYVHQVHFNYKLAGVGGEYAWHSDYTFWHYYDGMPNPNAISALYLLDDMTDENGPLEVKINSHKGPVQKPPKGEWTIKHDSKELPIKTPSKTAYKRHTVLGKAGDVVLMHANLLHASKANKSHKNRKVLFICYNSLKNATTEALRPGYITLKNFKTV